MLKIRLMGPPEEMDQAVQELRRVFRVIDISQPYANRSPSGHVRVYVEADVLNTISTTGTPTRVGSPP